MDSFDVAYYLAVASVVGGAVTAFILRDIRRTEAIKPYIVIGAIMALSASCATYSYAYFTIGVKEISIGSMFNGEFVFAKIKSNGNYPLVSKKCFPLDKAQGDGVYTLICNQPANPMSELGGIIARRQMKEMGGVFPPPQ